MINFIEFKNKLKFLKNISQKERRIILIFSDLIIIILGFLGSFLLSYSSSFSQNINSFSQINLIINKWLIPISLILGIIIYFFSGQYRGLSRYVGSKLLYQIIYRNALLVFSIFITSNILGFNALKINFWFNFWIILSGLSGYSRILIKDILFSIEKKSKKTKKIAIFGAGSEGAQLASTLRLSSKYQIFCFLDYSPNLWNRSLWGIPIKSPQEIKYIKDEIEQVLIAIPSLTRQRRREIVNQVQEHGLSILEIPSSEDLLKGKARIDEVKPIVIEELLGRDEVKSNKQYLENSYKDLVICVTGAGGSIGLEICRQLLNLNPSKLVLIEQSEHNLYLANYELEALKSRTELKLILGSTQDKLLLKKNFLNNKVDIVFHCSAYKHVPIVEMNPIEGIQNNIFSTKNVCEASLEAKVKKMILISTDKAVRPTNIMGASKRLAELVVQAFAIKQENLNKNQDKTHSSTCFSMVRFGNVLASSGSVVPLFKKQIENGGPITLTHKEVVRYFMTISEAASLVLHASIMAKGGDVFLLDMGEPIRVFDLAEQMIKISGLSLKSSLNPEGDIEIIETGLRPGEKLFEELLIDGNSKSTSHPLIFTATENMISPEILWPKLDKLSKFIKDKNKEKCLEIVSELIPEWNRSSFLN